MKMIKLWFVFLGVKILFCLLNVFKNYKNMVVFYLKCVMYV